MKKLRIVPKKFPFTSDNIAAMKDAGEFLKKCMRDIDDRLLREGYEFHNGVLFHIKTGTPLSSEGYRKRRKHG